MSPQKIGEKSRDSDCPWSKNRKYYSQIIKPPAGSQLGDARSRRLPPLGMGSVRKPHDAVVAVVFTEEAGESNEAN